MTKSPSKSCHLDPIPTWLVKDCLDILLPFMTKIVNLSLDTSTMPDSYKFASLYPLIKSLLMDSEILKHFRPVSNLQYISKIIEKVVDIQLVEYMEDNDLYEAMQSAYRKFFSTETALLRVTSDVFSGIDNGEAGAILLIDMSAAFDTVHHGIMLSRLNEYLGIQGKALQWFESYLTNRKQAVHINGVTSEYHDLKFGVPQGSVLGPKLFSIYILPVGAIFRKYGLRFMIYADDKSIYLIFKPTHECANVTRAQLEACIKEVRVWFAINFLMCNPDKTEFLVVGSRFREEPPLYELSIAGDIISKSSTVKTLGVLFDHWMTLEPNVDKVVKECFFHLYQISSVRRKLTSDSAKILVQAYVISRLDYCNSLFIGLPKYLLMKLQSVQNAAARVVSGAYKFDHITPILQSLHWLKIAQRTQYKVSLITFKALNGTAPSYIRELLVPVDERRTRQLRSSHQKLLVTNKTKTKNYGDRAYCNAAPSIWNSLPDNLRKANSVSSFKSGLKTHLFKECYSN